MIQPLLLLRPLGNYETLDIFQAKNKLMRDSGKPSWWPAMVWPDPPIEDVIDTARSMQKVREKFSPEWLAMYRRIIP